MNASSHSKGHDRRTPPNGPRADKRRFPSPSRKGRTDESGRPVRDDRPPKRFSDDRPKRPYGDDRPPKRFSDDRPKRPYGDDRPPKRFSDDRPQRPRDDRPKRPYGDSRPPKPRKDNHPTPRQIALRILSDFDSRPGDPERIADKVLSRRFIDMRDRRLVFELVYGVLRNRMYLDYVVDGFLPEGRTLGPGNVKRALQLGVYQILFLDRVPDHAAVNEAVDMVKRDRSAPNAHGFVNAILRKVIANKGRIVLPDPQADLYLRLSIEFSHPKWLIERWISRYGLGGAKKILAFNNERPAVYLRRKMRDFTRRQFEHDVREICEPGGGYLGLYYKMRKHIDADNLRLLQSGLCVVQAPSSGWAAAMMDLRPGERVADLCCAPGGKATLMAEIVNDNGAVVACDISRYKMGLLTDTVEKYGLVNVYPIVCDSANPPFAGRFDKVLLDAPCSGTGVMQRHPEARFVRKPEDITESQNIQRKLLDSASNMVGEGGIIVYSTCSLEPEENEDQVKWFLENHPEFTLGDPPDVIPKMYADESKCLRITPHDHGMDGMFAARFVAHGKP